MKFEEQLTEAINQLFDTEHWLRQKTPPNWRLPITKDSMIIKDIVSAHDLAVREARKDEQKRYVDLDSEDLTGRTDHFTKCKLCLEPSHHCTCDQVVYAINAMARERLAELSDKEESSEK